MAYNITIMIKIPIVVLFSVLMLGMPGVYEKAFAGGGGSPIDIVFIIDNSVSMGGEIADVKANILAMDTDLVNAGVDPLYGLVRVGGPFSPNSGEDGAHFLQDLTDFTTFTAGGSPFQLLTANAGNPEAGSNGVIVAMDQMSFRGGGVPICVILITDEDDDSDLDGNNAGPWPQNVQALADLQATDPDAVLTLVGALTAGNTASTYSVLASTTGGDQIPITTFQNDASGVIAAITDKIIEQALPVGGEILSIDTTSLLIAGIQANLAWMIVPALLATGTGVVLLRKRLNIF